jgi:ribosomal protein S18 acetylase RimI-like enzyme
MILRTLAPADRPALAALLARIPQFTPDEVAVALELVDAALARPEQPDYLFQLAWQEVGPEGGPRLLGYVCFGPTPMTEGTFDLYWIASDPAARGQGVGSALVGALELELVRRGGRLVRLETSSQESYGKTHSFYVGRGFLEAARIVDFYKSGDDLVTYVKRLPLRAGATGQGGRG